MSENIKREKIDYIFCGRLLEELSEFLIETEDNSTRDNKAFIHLIMDNIIEYQKTGVYKK